MRSLAQFVGVGGRSLRSIEGNIPSARPKDKTFVFLDEAQFFTGWQVFVKSRYERGNIKFIITGSNSRLLGAEMATLLSGRSLNSQIYPFSFLN